ncbi:hypothetical protein KS4_09590 [Poriferisphaera corsica]|uniref:Uncharacterized protein n=1 Tax=Poriferisphaera corsica TaxID=2528020 RepID=A0A517YRS3_9BACT|nr:hypothetical protein KS4_09590 [Poriferisphaera corsica]
MTGTGLPARYLHDCLLQVGEAAGGTGNGRV